MSSFHRGLVAGPSYSAGGPPAPVVLGHSCKPAEAEGVAPSPAPLRPHGGAEAGGAG